jgi:hypothetical protein
VSGTLPLFGCTRGLSNLFLFKEEYLYNINQDQYISTHKGHVVAVPDRRRVVENTMGGKPCWCRPPVSLFRLSSPCTSPVISQQPQALITDRASTRCREADAHVHFPSDGDVDDVAGGPTLSRTQLTSPRCDDSLNDIDIPCFHFL